MVHIKSLLVYTSLLFTFFVQAQILPKQITELDKDYTIPSINKSGIQEAPKVYNPFAISQGKLKTLNKMALDSSISFHIYDSVYEKWKGVFAYDLKGRVLNNFYYFMDKNGQYCQSGKTMYAYDDDALSYTYSSYRFDTVSSFFIENDKRTLLFDVRGNLLEYTYIGFSGPNNDIESGNKTTYTYNSSNQVLSKISIDYFEDSIIQGKMICSVYNDFSQITWNVEYSYYHIIKNWVPIRQYLYTYTSTHQLKSETSQRWSWESHEWKNEDKAEYEYGQLNSWVSRIKFNWQADDWVFSSKYTTYFDSMNNMTQLSFFQFDTTNSSWFEYDRENITYNENNQELCKIFTERSKTDTIWRFSSKLENEYDEQGHLIRKKAFKGLNNTWIENNMLENCYNDNLIIKSTWYVWDTANQLLIPSTFSMSTSKGSWLPLYNYDYVYSGTTGRLTLILSNFANGSWVYSSKTVTEHSLSGCKTFEQNYVWDALANDWQITSEYSEQYNKNFEFQDLIKPDDIYSSCEENGMLIEKKYTHYIGSTASNLTYFYYYSPISLSGLSEADDSHNIKVYPNPATSNITVELCDYAPVTLELLDGKGLLLSTYPIQHKLILPTQNLAKGMYLIRVIDKGTILASRTFIKN